METAKLTYFVADTHLGIDFKDSADRERRFVAFLRSIDPARTRSLYLLGDVFDFWYEYRDVVPKGFSRVFAALLDLMEAGVAVWFFTGNHDVWLYHYFEELGMRRLEQPAVVEIDGKTFCIGHGDALGGATCGYRFMRWVFHNRPLQWLFSLLHPWFAFRIGYTWSKRQRLSHSKRPYTFKGEAEPLYKFAAGFTTEKGKFNDYRTSGSKSAPKTPDYFIFGHFHNRYEATLPSGARFFVLDDWFDTSNYILFDGSDCRFIEK
ncbi:MAG: UDP-2,3-diacylglucosamine diphosphatase [Bacteroidales bacterium]|nr:UDP-2,3-diacylglucosamine diphosphatase [Bacteroidales bacterium]